jgi:hypothetical protein
MYAEVERVCTFVGTRKMCRQVQILAGSLVQRRLEGLEASSDSNHVLERVVPYDTSIGTSVLAKIYGDKLQAVMFPIDATVST